jgi:hypothetical protein
MGERQRDEDLTKEREKTPVKETKTKGNNT